MRSKRFEIIYSSSASLLQQLFAFALSEAHLRKCCCLQKRYGFKAHTFHAADVNSKEEYDAKFGSDLFITVSGFIFLAVSVSIIGYEPCYFNPKQ